MEDQWSGSDTESIDSSAAEEEDADGGSSTTQKVAGINENGNFINGFWLND